MLGYSGFKPELRYLNSAEVNSFLNEESTGIAKALYRTPSGDLTFRLYKLLYFHNLRQRQMLLKLIASRLGKRKSSLKFHSHHKSVYANEEFPTSRKNRRQFVSMSDVDVGQISINQT